MGWIFDVDVNPAREWSRGVRDTVAVVAKDRARVAERAPGQLGPAVGWIAGVDARRGRQTLEQEFLKLSGLLDRSLKPDSTIIEAQQGLLHAQGFDWQHRWDIGAAGGAAWTAAGEHASLMDEFVEVDVEQGVSAIEHGRERSAELRSAVDLELSLESAVDLGEQLTDRVEFLSGPGRVAGHVEGLRTLVLGPSILVDYPQAHHVRRV